MHCSVVFQYFGLCLRAKLVCYLGKARLCAIEDSTSCYEFDVCIKNYLDSLKLNSICDSHQ